MFPLPLYVIPAHAEIKEQLKKKLNLFTEILPVEKTVEKILDAIKSNPKITQNQLAEIVGLTRRGIEWNLAKLKEKGIIKRIGSPKSGHWEVVEK